MHSRRSGESLIGPGSFLKHPEYNRGCCNLFNCEDLELSPKFLEQSCRSARVSREENNREHKRLLPKQVVAKGVECMLVSLECSVLDGATLRSSQLY